MNITPDQLTELERLASRMSRDSRWQVTLAAFQLGLRLGSELAESMRAQKPGAK